MTVSNMSIEWGARAGLIAPDETTYRFLEGRPGVQEPFERAVERWSHYVSDADASFDREIEVDASALAPQLTWGTNPGQTAPITDVVPDAGGRRRAARARLHGPHGRRAARGHARRPRLHRLVHERPPGRPARRGRGRARQARGVRACRRSSSRARCASRPRPRPRASTASSRKRASSGATRGARCASA